MNKKTTYLSLTGGLGNQLFQLAAGIHAVDNEKLILIHKLAEPRKDGNALFALNGLFLPENVVVDSKKRYMKLTQKCIGYNLRKGVDPKNWEKKKIVSWLTTKITQAILFCEIRKVVKVLVCQGVGFSNLAIQKRDAILIGYFQTFKWVSDPRVKSVLEKLKPKIYSKNLDEYIALAKKEKPLFVHLRLSDYRHEDKFGIPNKQYYFNAITKLMQNSNLNKIWLFTDDPMEALNFFPIEYRDITEIVPEIDNSSALTFELLRYGAGYVIANSSFSWWGAFLRYDKKAKVIAPYPWFSKMESPSYIIPKDWESNQPWE